MLTNYPNIHSLSTLGVIYHFNSNYRFHSLRTDFAGEGGSGKTMIADMIQLILVGPGEYESATEANDDRPVDGIILKPKNNQYGASYILLNIEVNPKKYIAIGVFIEKSSKQARMFIAQAGFDWEHVLEPLSKPIYFEQLLVNGKILPIEELQHKLQEIHIKPLTLKQYHQLLFNNQILPIDLSEKKTLESYAAIFRSFSRGSGFKKDSHSLKVFLFGEDQKKLIDKYQTEVKSISDDYHEHDRYKKEISLINQKQGFIKDVFALEKTYKTLKKQYFSTKVLYWREQQRLTQSEFDEAKKEFDKSNLEELYISAKEVSLSYTEADDQAKKYSISKEALSSIVSKKKIIDQEKIDKYNILKSTEEKQSKIHLIERLLRENENSIDNVKQAYQKETAYKGQKVLLESFESHLADRQIGTDFNKSNWVNDFLTTKNTYDTKIAQLKVRLDDLKSLLNFADLQNPLSLASWGMNYFKNPLSLEEESILIYFQKFPRERRDFDRYISSPAELFENLDIKDSNKDGFWLNLDGVYEYIQYVPQQYLNIPVSERKKLEANLASLAEDVKTEYVTLDNDIKQQELLKEYLFDFGGLEEAIKLYNNRQTYSRSVKTEYANLNQVQFDELIEMYARKDSIIEEHRKADSAYNAAILSENDVDPNNFGQQFKDAKKYFSDRNIAENDITAFIQKEKKKLESLNKNLEELKKDQSNAIIESIEQNLFKMAGTLPLVTQLKSEHYRNYVILKADYESKERNMLAAKTNLSNALNDYQEQLKEKFDFNLTFVENIFNPDDGSKSLKVQYESARVGFEVKYNQVTEELEEGIQLKGSFHTGQLAHRLLPTVFVTPVLENEDQLNEKLTERLNKLYQTIREIGSRKIEILKRVFTEVNKTYRSYLEKVNSIDSYFKKPNKSITGGNKASLKYTSSVDYPAKWMSVFNRILDDQINNFGLFEQLSEEIDINDMMKKAFINEGGTKEAKIEDLLDPKSYFDLDFDLKLENGDKNSGSNSQTYSGNALLGLARLSLIGDEKQPGIRIMPIDEAQGLGSNYEMLKGIAVEENYQILTMSIDTAGEIKDGEQYIYILSENKLLDEDNYVPAMGIFSDNIITRNINDFINAEGN